MDPAEVARAWTGRWRRGRGHAEFLRAAGRRRGAGRKAHAQGALLIAAADPVSLGVLEAPGAWGADIAVGEGQGLGNALNYGGPYLGLFACKKAHMRHIPGRICGLTTDAEGRAASC
jgi:glycine dehydrogenase subunit 1